MIDRLLGLKNEALPAAAPSAQSAAAGTTAEAGLLQTIVDSVWSEDVVAQLSTDADLADDFADYAQSLMLAVTIPVTSMRTASANFPTSIGRTARRKPSSAVDSATRSTILGSCS